MKFEDLGGDWPDVSRETFEDLSVYAAMLRKWNQAINLVARDTLEDVWSRHILDSVQLWRHLPPSANSLLDIGSGAGFPGLVLAIIARNLGSSLKVTLVDSDHRKCEFLRSAAREVSLHVAVIADRVDRIPVHGCDVITARALASVDTLLGYAKFHLAPDGIALFLKGEAVERELIAARQTWAFHLDEYQSATNPRARILKIGDLRRV